MKSFSSEFSPDEMLHKAVNEGDLPLALITIQAGADVNAPVGMFQEAALALAARKSNLEMVRLLLSHGADVNFRGGFCGALCNSVRHAPDREVFETLLTAGADIHAKYHGRTVFMDACEGGDQGIIRRLAELGADIHAVNPGDGKTALDYLLGTKDKELLAYLRSLGIVSNWEKLRELARALASKQGKKPVECSSGFLLNTRLVGGKCQCFLSVNDCSFLVYGLRAAYPAFRSSKQASLVITESEPVDPACAFACVEGARFGSGHQAFRMLSPCPLAEHVASACCQAYATAIEDFRLEPGESLMLGGRSVSLVCQITESAHVLKRLDALADLVSALFLPPEPDRLLYEEEWLLKKAKKPVSGMNHQFGGVLDQPVSCPFCQGNTHLMARLELGDPSLPQTDLGRNTLPVMWCMNCGEWQPAFFDLSGEAAISMPVSAENQDLTPACMDEEPLPPQSMRLVMVPKGKKAGRASKLGGKPSWIQTDETPDCPQCDRLMAFVLQLRSNEDMSYADDGMLYTFACPECQVIATLVQSH